MTCKLCLKDKKLIKSHIIPQFMYKRMKDDNKIFYSMTYNFHADSSKRQKMQTGDFDKEILCEDCDNKILGTYENYAKESMHGKIKQDIAPICKNLVNPNDGLESTICTNINYKLKKNFLLSILWRSSITNRPFFNSVQLGPKHEERIRDILYNNLLTDENEYPILTFSFFRTENIYDNLIGQPIKFKNVNNITQYVFLINGFQYFFFVNAKHHKLPDYVEKGNLKKDGTYSIVHCPADRQRAFLKSILNI